MSKVWPGTTKPDAPRRAPRTCSAVYRGLVGGRRAAREPDAGPQFRAEALRQLDVPSTLDNLLLLTSRRTWLAIVGIAVALVARAGLCREHGPRRGGSSPGTGRGTTWHHQRRQSGHRCHHLRAARQGRHRGRRSDPRDRSLGRWLGIGRSVTSARHHLAATAAAGAVVGVGTVVTQILPPDSGFLLMLQVPESTAGPIAVGQAVELSYGAGGTATGSVTAIDTGPCPRRLRTPRWPCPPNRPANPSSW